MNNIVHPLPSPGPHAKCIRILRGNPPAAGANAPAREGADGQKDSANLYIHDRRFPVCITDTFI